MLMQQQQVYAYAFEGKRYDTGGDKAGYVQAIIDFALERPSLREGGVMSHLREAMKVERYADRIHGIREP